MAKDGQLLHLSAIFYALLFDKINHFVILTSTSTRNKKGVQS